MDVPALADSLIVGSWIPYPKFLAMFEGQEPQDTTADGDQINVSVASVQPEKLKVTIIVSIVTVCF